MITIRPVDFASLDYFKKTTSQDKIHAGCLIAFVTSEMNFSSTVPEKIAALIAPNKQLLGTIGFVASLGQIQFVPVHENNHTLSLLLVGLGKNKKGEFEHYRRALGRAIRELKRMKIESATLLLPPESLFAVEKSYLVEQTVIIANMANYQYLDFLTQEDRRDVHICDLSLALDAVTPEVTAAVETGRIIALGVNRARHWIDMPPSLLTPAYLAEKAREIAQEGNLKFTEFSEEEINKMGMGGLAGVSRGSELDAKLVILEYQPDTKKNSHSNSKIPTIVFAGKGITFDSGGLSIKPASHMEEMKYDMSGAAAVISTMGVLSALRPSVRIIGIAPIAENLPSGNALKPGDIVRFYNGKTAEVRNTDAEGRLILADALSYAVQHYEPDAIVDIATLTGSCASALGPFYAGLLSQHDDIVTRISRAADASGERVWRLPLHDDYAPAIRSEVADLCNCGSSKYMAGAITAGHFLKAFVGTVPWAHLDIAGTAFNAVDIPYFRPGATGYGVRLLTALAMQWNAS